VLYGAIRFCGLIWLFLKERKNIFQPHHVPPLRRALPARLLLRLPPPLRRRRHGREPRGRRRPQRQRASRRDGRVGVSRGQQREEAPGARLRGHGGAAGADLRHGTGRQGRPGRPRVRGLPRRVRRRHGGR
jgi:hypothetical protein